MVTCPSEDFSSPEQLGTEQAFDVQAVGKLLEQAELLYDVGKIDLAQALALRAHALMPTSAPHGQEKEKALQSRVSLLLGMTALVKGDHAQACPHLEHALVYRENDPDLLSALGTCHKRLGRPDQAVVFYRQALELRPDDPSILFNLGLVLQLLNDFSGAVACLKDVVASGKMGRDGLEALAGAYLCQGNMTQSLICYRDLAAAYPHHPAGCAGQGRILLAQDKPEQALPHCRAAAELDPESVDHAVCFGDALYSAGRASEALIQYERAVRLSAKESFPDSSDLHNNLGVAFKALGRYTEAKEQFSLCLQSDSRHVPSLVNLGIAAKEAGEAASAQELLERAVAIAPGRLDLHLYLCMSRIPFMYETEEDIARVRDAYAKDLQALDRMVSQADDAALHTLASVVGSLQPYYLAYQGQSDLDLQVIYGRSIARAVRSAYGALAAHDLPDGLIKGERIRVGFVSGHFFNHSVWKMPLQGWIQGLDRERFEVFCYSVSACEDQETLRASRLSDSFHAGLTTLRSLTQAVQRDAPHVLVYPEIGMNPLCAKAACLRLAPVQCSSWGHPETSGLDSVDYFLSSDLMEPQNGQEHYQERLIRLSGLGVAYSPPGTVPAQLGRADFDLGVQDVVYLCLQTPYKYLPRHDAVFAAIARRVPRSRFVFLQINGATKFNSDFAARLRRAFSASGLNPDNHLVFLPHMPAPKYHALVALGDVFLDSFAWSGCNTTLETLRYGIPGVTLPGEMMRGRHTMAILQTVGLEELIASSVGEYVEIGVRLGLDQAWRKKMSVKILENLPKCYDDKEAVSSFERFLEETVNALEGTV